MFISSFIISPENSLSKVKSTFLVSISVIKLLNRKFQNHEHHQNQTLNQTCAVISSIVPVRYKVLTRDDDD